MWYHCSCQKASRFHWQKGSQNCQGFCLFPSLFWGEYLVPRKNVPTVVATQIFFLFSALKLGKISNLTIIFFRWGWEKTTNQMWDSTRSWHPFATTIGCLETLLIAPRGGGSFGQLGPHDLIYYTPPEIFHMEPEVRSPEIKEVPNLESIIFIHFQIPC